MHTNTGQKSVYIFGVTEDQEYVHDGVDVVEFLYNRVHFFGSNLQDTMMKRLSHNWDRDKYFQFHPIYHNVEYCFKIVVAALTILHMKEHLP